MDEIVGTDGLASGVTRRTALIGAGGIAALLGLGLPLASSKSAEASNNAWGGYSNGQIPLSALTVVAGVYLRADAAAAMSSLLAAYHAQFGTSLGILEGYRNLADQQADWNAYQNGTGNLAATPGQSVHGWALAVDFNNPIHSHTQPQFSWMQANAGTYGWWWAGATFSQIEYWHWEYNGAYTAPTAPSQQEDDVMLIRNSARGDFFATPGVVKHSANPNVFNLLAAGGATVITVVDSNIDATLTAFAGDAFVYPPSGGIYVNPGLV